MESSSLINFILIFLITITGGHCNLNVTMEVIPKVAEPGSSVTIRCNYPVDDDQWPIYKVGWYHNDIEFYRYVPKNQPDIQIFPIRGVRVDRDKSNRTQVTIKNVDYDLSGEIRCEVATDAPMFWTEFHNAKLIVASLPKSKPNIITEHSQYQLGDTLNANCSLPPSRPAVKFVFMLNNVQIDPIDTIPEHTGRNDTGNRNKSHLQSASISVNITPEHFSPDNQLILRCIAQIPNGLYHDESSIKLSVPVVNVKPKNDAVAISNGEKVTERPRRTFINWIFSGTINFTLSRSEGPVEE